MRITLLNKNGTDKKRLSNVAVSRVEMVKENYIFSTSKGFISLSPTSIIKVSALDQINIPLPENYSEDLDCDGYYDEHFTRTEYMAVKDVFNNFNKKQFWV